MISCPRVGQSVQVWYRWESRPYRPLHGLVGTVAVASRGRPRNHGVVIGGVLQVVPAGNLRRIEVQR